jgi:ribonuclease HII
MQKPSKKWLEFPITFDNHTIFVDEAARGPLAFSLVVVATRLQHTSTPAPPVADSKLLSKTQRQEIVKRLKGCGAVDYNTCEVTPRLIDEVGMAEAWKIGIRVAVTRLAKTMTPHPDTGKILIVIDGGFCGVNLPNDQFDVSCIIKGDRTNYGIACAGLIAKTAHTDNVERDIALLTPSESELFKTILSQGSGYWFSQAHADLLNAGNFTKFHRKSFKPLREALGRGHTRFAEGTEDAELVPLSSYDR